MVAPIGFLGMPLILSFAYRLLGSAGLNFFVPLLALLTLIPLWKSLPQKWPRAVKLMTLIVWMSFPSVILYTNRGAFPQMTQLCLMIWVWYLIAHANIEFRISYFAGRFQSGEIARIMAGFLSGFALMIRPIEAIWIIPVIILAFTLNSLSEIRNTKYEIRSILLFLIPLLLILLVGAKLGSETYGHWFVSGYQIRPEVAVALNEEVLVASTESNAVSFISVLPFGFHPKNIWWNFKNYIIWFFLPWMSLLLGSLAILYKEKFWKSRSLWPVIALAWTVLILTVFYGNGIYQDHVRLNEISIGNSFIRYILPISVVFSISAGFIFSRLWSRWSLKIFALCLAVGLTTFGLWTAIHRDDEGIAAIEQELIAYQSAREAAAKNFPKEGIILSDRSDKIFFPAHLAVSPMPDFDKITDLFVTGIKLRVYLPTQDEKGLAVWQENGFNLRPIFTTGNQTLYDVY